MADLACDDLIDRDARVNIRSGGLPNPNAGQECAARTRVVARTVRPGGGIHLIQPGDDLNLTLDSLKGLHGAVELEVFLRSAGLRPPGGLDGSIGHVNKGQPLRCRRCCAIGGERCRRGNCTFAK